jgi:hypothetical protein
MNSSKRIRMSGLVETLLTTISFFGSCLMLAAQGYLYTFQGQPGYQQLDGSYIVLSNVVASPPTSADLLDIKILDSFGGSVFSVTVAPQDFRSHLINSLINFLYF